MCQAEDRPPIAYLLQYSQLLRPLHALDSIVADGALLPGFEDFGELASANNLIHTATGAAFSHSIVAVPDTATSDWWLTAHLSGRLSDATPVRLGFPSQLSEQASDAEDLHTGFDYPRLEKHSCSNCRAVILFFMRIYGYQQIAAELRT